MHGNMQTQELNQEPSCYEVTSLTSALRCSLPSAESHGEAILYTKHAQSTCVVSNPALLWVHLNKVHCIHSALTTTGNLKVMSHFKHCCFALTKNYNCISQPLTSVLHCCSLLIATINHVEIMPTIQCEKCSLMRTQLFNPFEFASWEIRAHCISPHCQSEHTYALKIVRASSEVQDLGRGIGLVSDCRFWVQPTWTMKWDWNKVMFVRGG